MPESRRLQQIRGNREREANSARYMANERNLSHRRVLIRAIANAIDAKIAQLPGSARLNADVALFTLGRFAICQKRTLVPVGDYSVEGRQRRLYIATKKNLFVQLVARGHLPKKLRPFRPSTATIEELQAILDLL